jgi:DNA repair photolyase
MSAPNKPIAQLALPMVAPPAPGRATGLLLDERNATEYVEMTCRSILNWVQSSRIGEVFTVNPYRGCEFGCAYCYARYTHEFLDLEDWLDFERKIFVKVNAGAAMRRDLRRSDVQKHGIAIGTATDPYQPAERIFGITRRILEALLPLNEIPISIVTKSGLIERDVDLLKQLSARHPFEVRISCVTTDPVLQRALEPRAHVPSRRFGAMTKLAAAGVPCGVLIAPILPGISDGEENLRAVMKAAKENGASFYGHTTLFLTDASKKRFFPWVEEHAPNLSAQYAERYASGMYQTPAYRHKISTQIQRVAREVGLPARSPGMVPGVSGVSRISADPQSQTRRLTLG